MTGAECPGRTFAMNEQFALFALDRVRFSLAGVVRDVEQRRRSLAGKK